MREREYVEHPLLKPKSIEARLYQQVIAARASSRNSMIVLPTGLGKTAISIMIMGHRLQKFPRGRALMLAPTRPLAIQHHREIRKAMALEEGDIHLVTGKITPEKRRAIWEAGKAFSATPQTVENDLINNRLDLTDFVILIFDEAHRAIGDYPYTAIAREYTMKASNPLTLALTASPGSNKEKIAEIVRALRIEHIEARTRDSPDVRGYVAGLKTTYLKVELRDDHKRAVDLLRSFLNRVMDELKVEGHLRGVRSRGIGLKNLLGLKTDLVAAGDREAVAKTAVAIKLYHLINLLETQGPRPALGYLEKLRKLHRRAWSDTMVLEDPGVIKVEAWLKSLPKNVVHPKVETLKDIMEGEISKGRPKKVIVFANYRKTAESLLEHLSDLKGVRPSLFVGQANREGMRGMSQEEQKRALDQFTNAEYNALIATSIGEEGLDVPEVDLVVFYDAVPSVIRQVQRRGRTARGRPGRVTVLLAGSREESFYWSTVHKEKKMFKALDEIKRDLEGVRLETTAIPAKKGGITSLDPGDGSRRAPEAVVKVDVRELGSGAVRALASFSDIKISVFRLKVGDYLVSDRMVVERKTVDDLAASIVDGRMFEQVRKLKGAYDRPILLIEGEEPYRARKRAVSPRSLMGLVATLAAGGTSILWARDSSQSAEMIRLLALQEQKERKRYPTVKMAPPKDEMRLVERVLATIPGIGVLTAYRILAKLKTLRRVFSASREDLMKVEGVGPSLAKNIVRFSNLAYDRAEEAEG